jgi:hypothetical protein
MSKASRARQQARAKAARTQQPREPASGRQQPARGAGQRGGQRPARDTAGRTRQQQAREKLARVRAAEARRRRRAWALGGSAAAVLIAVAVTLAVVLTGHSGASPGAPRLRLAPISSLGSLRPAPAPGPLGPEGVPVPAAAPLAAPSPAVTGQPVDGIHCDTTEQLVFHIHAHLTIFVNGAARQVPYGIGIPRPRVARTPQGPDVISGACFYWLHTHAADGIIHIESPVHRAYTLGNLFDEWRQPLGDHQVGPAAGRVVAVYNGQRYLGNPRDIPLTAHAQIQLEVGRPLIAPVRIRFPNGI